MKDMKESGIEWIGKIPQDWTLRRIQYCLSEIKVQNNPIQTEQVLSLVKDVGVMLYEEKGDVGNKSKTDVSEYKLAFPHTLVVNSMNILIGSVGISNYFGCVSPVYYVFKETDAVDLRYIDYIFNTREFQRELRKYANGILEIRLRVSADDIFKRRIPMPSKTEQVEIADYLDAKCAEIDTLSADIQSEIDTLEAYKRSVITETVTRGITSLGFVNTGSNVWSAVPEKWRLVNIKYLFEIVKRIAGKEGYDILAITKQGIKVKDISLNEGQIASDYSGYQFVYPGDFAMNCLDLNAGWIDISRLFGVTSPDYRVFRLREQNNHCADYYKYLFQMCYTEKIFYSLTQGVTESYRRLPASVFNNFKVPVPPKDEQVQIATFLDKICGEVDTIIAQKREQLTVLADYKKSVIYEYVTGKKEAPVI